MFNCPPRNRGSAKSSSSITTPSNTFIIGGISNNRRLIGCSGPKTVPAAIWYNRE